MSASGSVSRPGGDRLHGSCPVALGGAWAHLHLAPVGGDLAIVTSDAAGVRAEQGQALDPSLGLVKLELDGVEADPGGLLPGGLAVAVRLLRVVAAAEAAGGSRACLEMALAYA